MWVFANPDFGDIAAGPRLEETNAVALRSVEMRDLQGISLPSLPGTEKEAAELETRAKKSNWQPQTYLGANATEAELRKVNSPRILHLATHGFFLPEIDLGKTIDPRQPGQDIPKGKLVNPMHRSGLAMAGAQRTLQAWGRGDVPPTENDGIVTAEEVGGLKLNGTWFVVLSACDTGIGKLNGQEGVATLVRPFLVAGAQSVLANLWQADDQFTLVLMREFYSRLARGATKAVALREAKLELIKRFGAEAPPALWAGFVLVGEGAN